MIFGIACGSQVKSAHHAFWTSPLVAWARARAYRDNDGHVKKHEKRHKSHGCNNKTQLEAGDVLRG